MKLDLKRIWEVVEELSKAQDNLSEKDIYVLLLGHSSEYSSMSFEHFLEYYSFKVEDNNVVVFNNDGIPYEEYSNNDYSYIPIPVLGFGKKELENYINQTVNMQLKQQEKDKEADRERIKEQIKRLEKQLEI